MFVIPFVDIEKLSSHYTQCICSTPFLDDNQCLSYKAENLTLDVPTHYSLTSQSLPIFEPKP